MKNYCLVTENGNYLVNDEVPYFISPAGKFLRFSTESEYEYLKGILSEVLVPRKLRKFRPTLWQYVGECNLHCDYSQCENGFVGQNNGRYAYYQHGQFFGNPVTGEVQIIVKHSNSSEFTHDDNGHYCSSSELQVCQILGTNYPNLQWGEQGYEPRSYGFEQIATPVSKVFPNMVMRFANGLIEVTEYGATIKFGDVKDIRILYGRPDTYWYKEEE